MPFLYGYTQAADFGLLYGYTQAAVIEKLETHTENLSSRSIACTRKCGCSLK